MNQMVDIQRTKAVLNSWVTRDDRLSRIVHSMKSRRIDTQLSNAASFPDNVLGAMVCTTLSF